MLWALVLVAAVGTLSAEAKTTKTLGCIVGDSGETKLYEDVPYSPAFHAWAEFNDTLFDVGWGTLTVRARSSAPATDSAALECAGVVEGVLTHARVAAHFALWKLAALDDLGGGSEWPQTLVAWISENLAWTRAQAAANGAADPWWRAVSRVLTRFDGLRRGYGMARTAAEANITELEFYMLQASGDMEDITTIVTKARRDYAWHDTHHHCTGLVQMSLARDDVWFAQDSWTGYDTLNRMLKDYEVRTTDAAAAHRWTFSSNAGVMLSLDDFWLLDSGLAVLETTLHTWNETLYDLFCTPKSVLSWIRVQVANTLATNGKDWIEDFSRENSYTYNNQYFVLDTSKMRSGGVRPYPGLLWTVEQVPGHVVSGDRTDELFDNRWVPSINTPFFDEVWTASGYPEQVIATNCSYWSYYNCSRMLIMERDLPLVSTYDKFRAFMRYNDWQNDPLSNGDAAQSILSRYDLRPDDCIIFGAMKLCPHGFGGADSKTTNLAQMRSLRFDAVSSPQYETQPAWEFGTARFPDVRWAGLPKGPWQFPWIQFGPN